MTYRNKKRRDGKDVENKTGMSKGKNALGANAQIQSNRTCALLHSF